MREETKIAKENVRDDKGYGEIKMSKFTNYTQRCLTHKQTCQRWLDFLEEVRRYKFRCGYMGDLDLCEIFEDNKLINDKITDLEQTIKIYEDNKV